MVYSHSGEVIDVARLCKTHNRMDQDIGLTGTCSADSQFSMGSVHRVSSLKCNDAAPAKLFEMGSEFRGSVSQSDVIVMLEPVDGIELTTDVELLG